MQNFERPRLKDAKAPQEVSSMNFIQRNARKGFAAAKAKDANISSTDAPGSDQDNHTSSITEVPSHSGKTQPDMVISPSHEQMVNQGYSQILDILQVRRILKDQAPEKMLQDLEGNQNAENINPLRRNQSLAENSFRQQREWKQRKITNLWKSRSTSLTSTQWPLLTAGSRPKPTIIDPRTVRKWLSTALDVAQIIRRGRVIW